MAPRVCALVAMVTAMPASAADPPEVRREFRGVWVATVANDGPDDLGFMISIICGRVKNVTF